MLVTLTLHFCIANLVLPLILTLTITITVPPPHRHNPLTDPRHSHKAIQGNPPLTTPPKLFVLLHATTECGTKTGVARYKRDGCSSL